MMSAGTLRPSVSSTPPEVNVSICPVTTDALPSRMARNRSPSGTMHIRWAHGWYGGLKCSSTGKSAGSSLTLRSLITLRAAWGQRWQNRQSTTWRLMFSHRVIA